jgi:Spy/CpxP family protein refolding chaperone
MTLQRLAAVAATTLVLAACDKSPTQPSLTAQLDQVDPYVLTFSATNGLPSGPFHIPGPGSLGNARGPGAPFPDSLKLTAAQQAAIQALRDAFATAHAADLAKLQAIHDQARAAIQAGKPRAEVRAIIETARPVLESLKGAFDALRTAIEAVLTPAQKAWIAAHRPDGPPPRP